MLHVLPHSFPARRSSALRLRAGRRRAARPHRRRHAVGLRRGAHLAPPLSQREIRAGTERVALVRPGAAATGLPPRPALFLAKQSMGHRDVRSRSEEHTSELQSLMRISYAVFCLKKKKNRELMK